jgi:hypothetical protein
MAHRLTGTGVAANCLCPLERLLTWLKVGNPERGAGNHRQPRQRSRLGQCDRRLLFRQ